MNPAPSSADMSVVLETLVEFDLPFALPLPDGVYPLSLRKKTVMVKVSRIIRQEVQLKSASGEMRLVMPGMFDHTHVIVRMPSKVDYKEKSTGSSLLSVPPKRKVKELAIAYVNRLIDVVRIVEKQYHLERIGYQDVPAYRVWYWDGKVMSGALEIFLEKWLGPGGFPAKPVDPDQVKVISECLSKEEKLGLSENLILNAMNASFKEDYRKATLEAVMALEVGLSEFIRREGNAKGVQQDRIESFIVDVGLTANLEVVLRMLVPSSKLPEANVLAICKGAIKVRNDILHRGLEDVPAGETEKRIESVVAMMAYLKCVSSP